MTYTKHNYDSIAQRYPDKPVVITEPGWATQSIRRGIHPDNVGVDFQ